MLSPMLNMRSYQVILFISCINVSGWATTPIKCEVFEFPAVVTPAIRRFPFVAEREKFDVRSQYYADFVSRLLPFYLEHISERLRDYSSPENARLVRRIMSRFYPYSTEHGVIPLSTETQGRLSWGLQIPKILFNQYLEQELQNSEYSNPEALKKIITELFPEQV